jgi:2-oxoisovalerate dehydrogenase E2 component (dihydrolipoyl transacylase)
MARYVVKVPDIGEGMTEAEVVTWHVRPGQAIREDDPLVEIMTDKATVELPAPVGGTVVEIHGEPGEKRAVGSDLVVLDVAGEGNVAEAVSARPSPSPSSTPLIRPQAAALRHPRPASGEREGPATQEREGEGQEAPTAEAMPVANEVRIAPVSRRLGDKLLASPAVRRRAWDLGIPLQFVPGTGPAGRITRDDLETYVADGGAMPTPATQVRARSDVVKDVPIVGLRRAIAEHLQQSKRQIPHFSYIEEVEVTALEELRAQLNQTHADRGHLTLLPFLMRAIVVAVADHPQVNARYDDEAGVLQRHRAVHLGIATQTDRGLMVPVARHAEAFDLWQSADESRRLATAAREGKAARDELTGSTITLTSLGPLGGLAATPIVNYPEVAIVGVNRIAERPVVRDGQIVIRKMMNLSSSFDHRIVDGWEAASFIQRVKQLLEQPALLFIS